MKKIIAILALSACSPAVPPPAVPPPPPCPILASSGWSAWVNTVPGRMNARSTLHVVGKVTVPSGEWTPRFGGIRVMESHPLQVVAELDAASSGAGIQAVLEREVRGSWQVAGPVGAVTIICRGTTLARIDARAATH